MEETLLAVLNQYEYKNPDAKVYIQCYEAESLKKLRFELETNLPLVQLISGSKSYAPMWTEEGLNEIATYADGIGPSKSIIENNPTFVYWAHDRGLVVHPYTFRADSVPNRYRTFEEELYRFYFVYKVDGLFTDFSDRVVQILHLSGVK